MKIKTAKIKFVLAMMLVAAFLSSCGKEKKDDIADELDAVHIETGTDAQKAGVPKHLEYVVPSVFGDTMIKVSADVETNDLGNAYVYEADRKEFNEESLKQLADSFFDGDYTYIKPYVHCSREELEQEKRFYQELIDKYGDEVYTFVNVYRNKIDDLLDGYDENNTAYTEHDGLIYHSEQWTENDGFYDNGSGDGFDTFRVTAADYSRLRGEADGHIYELYYEKYYLQNKITPYFNGYIEYIGGQHDEERVIIKCVDSPYYVNLCKDMEENPQLNTCDYDTALKQAEETVKSLGFQKLELSGTRQLDIDKLTFTNERTALGLNGYEFWFSPAMNGKYAFDCRGMHMIAFGSDHDETWVYETGQPLLRVLVTDMGVLEITIGDMYSIGEQKKAELMPFEQIDGFAQEYMGSYSATEDMEITNVKLGYLYVSYDGINYSLIPAWAYYLDNGEVFLYINALDGEQIIDGSQKIVLGYHPVASTFFMQVQYIYR
ncbi:MAG: DUF6034 family protein [Clostridium sp.]|nr:DUF6034 family protein [Clostridium sp.]MCM1398515.1 DUF6034 family protein [Clostridium sp.]MCM1460237.1 DUF6034 family protein [Bacteroides sp.]